MTWFEKIIPSRIKTERRTRSVPEGLWMKCPACDAQRGQSAMLKQLLHVDWYHWEPPVGTVRRTRTNFSDASQQLALNDFVLDTLGCGHERSGRDV